MTSIAERRKQFLAKKRRKAADNDDDQEKLIAITENYSVYTKSGQMVKHFHKESLKALQKEMEILRSLEHKNIVKFYATDDSAFKIVMERYEKGSLQKLVHEPMYTYTMTTLTVWMKEILSALEYLQTKNIVHADIKPENIFLTDCFSLKIGDFGSAFYYNKGENSTITSELDKNIGSPSPAVSPNEITHKSDIYSAGIVLWELCERRRPFQFVDNVFNALLEELDVKNEKLKKLTASCANHVPEKRPSASEALEVLQEIENVYDKFSFLPEFKQDETQLIRPIGFDGTNSRVPVNKSGLHGDQLLIQMESTEAIAPSFQFSLNDTSFIKNLLSERSRTDEEPNQVNIETQTGLFWQNLNSRMKNPKEMPSDRVTIDQILGRLKKNGMVTNRSRSSSSTGSNSSDGFPQKPRPIKIKPDFQVQEVRFEELSSLCSKPKFQEQTTAFLKSFLLLASCTMLEILPPLIQRMNACLEKLAELLEIFEWPAYLKVFLNVNTGEEWYYFGETPCENIPFHQHILMRKSDWKVKVLFGVWEGKTTLVIENKYHIKQQKLQLMGCEWITHEWIVDQIRTLQLKRDTLIGLLLKDERDTHAFEANGSMIWRTDDAGAVDMVLMLAFITAPKETLLSYYGCSKENLASYEGFFEKLAFNQLINDEAISHLCSNWNISPNHIFPVSDKRLEPLELRACPGSNSELYFFIESPIQSYEGKVACFTGNFKFQEITVSKETRESFVEKAVDVSKLDKILEKKLKPFPLAITA